MKQRKIKVIAMTLIALFASTVLLAQGWNVEEAKFQLEEVQEPDLEKTVKVINEAAEHPKTKNDPKMYYYRGLTYLRVMDNPNIAAQYPDALDIALESFNKALETDVKNKYSDNAKTNLLNVVIGFYNRGYAAYQAGDYESAIKDFDQAIPLMKYDVDGNLRRNNLTEEVLIQLKAYASLNNGDNKMAMDGFKQLINKGFNDPNIYSGLAQLQLNEKDTTGAMATISSGREMFETDKNLINLELDIYLKQGRSEELIEKLNKAIEQDPENTIYYFARAISFEGLKQFDKARADYDKIIELDPAYFDAHYNIGVMYVNQVSTLVEEMNSKGVYDPKLVAQYTDKINALYIEGIAFFEIVFENNTDMTVEDKIELANTMKKIYAQLNNMDKYAEMKAWIEANK